MINRNGRHGLGRRNISFLESLIAGVILQSVKNHRAYIPGCWLQEVANDLEIVLHVAQSAGIRHEAQQAGQTISPLQIVSATMSVARLPAAGLIADRKSTRLNSSHE